MGQNGLSVEKTLDDTEASAEIVYVGVAKRNILSVLQGYLKF